jgi:hypothetical protein
VGPRAGVDPLDDVEKRKFLTLPGLELLPHGRPARRQPLFRFTHTLSTKHNISYYMFTEYHIILNADLTPNTTTPHHSKTPHNPRNDGVPERRSIN